ncbi:MAG: hypothetical protein ABSE22_10610 [Xanthobacteraceae bacterium]
MATLKTLTVAAALLAGATSLAMAQGQPTGGDPPVAGGAAGGGAPGVDTTPSNIKGTAAMTAPAQPSTKHKKKLSD